MKLPLLAGIAFVVGIAGGTGIGVMRAPKPVAIAAGADSTGHASSKTAAPDAANARPDAVAAAAHAAPPTSRADSSGAAVPAVTAGAHGVPDAAIGAAYAPVLPAGASAVPAPIPSTIHALPAREPEDFRQVARILTTMKPTDAAKILAFLGDDLVEGIVRAVGPRQAAVLMVHIPPQRAAGLSKRLIQHPTPEAK